MALPFRTILITGGSGSLAQALTRFLLSLSPDIAIRAFSRGEHRQAEMHATFQSSQIRYLIGDVRDTQRLRLACHGVDLVIHAAALKRQDTLEYNVYEGVQTNILGTQNVLRACADAGVQRCITISSDKAVYPITLYGQTKAVAEALTIQSNAYSPTGTRSCVVRWGNVAGSQGSVITIWRDALRQGMPLRVTDPTATRFWVDMAEAVQTVWQAACAPTRGMVYVPHSPAFTVRDLVVAMLRQHGRSVLDADAFALSTQQVGRRPAEKLHEVLLTEEEQARALWLGEAPCYVVPPVARTWDEAPNWAQRLTPVALTTPYASDVWPHRLDVAALQEKLERLV